MEFIAIELSVSPTEAKKILTQITGSASGGNSKLVFALGAALLRRG